MIRVLMLASMVVALSVPAYVRADNVLDWNSTVRNVIQDDGSHPVNKANPGWSTRAMAMTNGAIYDVYQAFNRTHAPFLVNTHAMANTSLDAAVHQAAYDVLLNSYPGESSILSSDYNARMATVPAGAAKTNGINLGDSIAQAYIANRASDHSGDMVPYTPGTLPGQWRPDPFHPAQTAWGPAWGAVQPFAIGASAPFVAALTPPPALNSAAYTAAYNQVKDYGVLNSASRTADEKEMALFWGYDRATMGPPPVLFDRNLGEIGAQVGNTPAQNARMFAMASVSIADACISAWDAKFSYNYWRPVTAIHEAGNDGSGFDDGNPSTVGDVNWRPLGAPGGDPNNFTDDFTPPFPSWTSGHATMGGALFKSLQQFFGTNSFTVAATNNGVIPGSGQYTLTSQEFAPNGSVGMSRVYSTFMQTGVMDVGTENSPEGENGMSRIYLGIHWIFDQRDGITLGNNIAGFVATHDFQAVPEPATLALGLIAVLGGGMMARRRRS
jgi:PEP-CTERM motif-containing protein